MNLISEINYQKRKFDIDSIEDIQEYKYFLDNKKWRNLCPFRVEWPYLTVTKMIEDQIVKRYIENVVDSKKFNFDELDKSWPAKLK